MPDDSGIYYNYANALGKAEKFEEAEKYFIKAMDLSPNVASYYSNLGELNGEL